MQRDCMRSFLSVRMLTLWLTVLFILLVPQTMQIKRKSLSPSQEANNYIKVDANDCQDDSGGDCCVIGKYFDTKTNKCQPCSAGCADCLGLSKCTQCIPSLFEQVEGAYVKCLCSDTSLFYRSTPTAGCVSCSTLFPNCQTCIVTLSGSKCQTCSPGYFQVITTGLCAACSSNCIQCTSATKCLKCDPLYTLKSSACAISVPCCNNSCSANCIDCNASVCITCTAGFMTDSSANCVSCLTALSDLACIECNLGKCTQCDSGFTLDPVSSICSLPDNSTQNQSIQNESIQNQCGDGNWIYPLEPCDDGNTVNFDGCNTLCQIEPDYNCSIPDKLPTGASLCKFTKNITIEMESIQKNTDSNIAQIFFIIQPQTFNQWTTGELEKLMSPITIVDQISGASTIIPFNSISFALQNLNGKNELEVVIDYGSNSIESSYLKFNINPNLTKFTSIWGLNQQQINYLKLSSSFNGVDLYSYSSETYQFQKSVASMSSAIGYLALAFTFLGLLSPVGKLIVVEALIVIQLSFFSILQFQKFPVTFIGLKNLILSNGYNQPNLFGPTILQKQQTVFNFMGMGQGFLQNYNISFILYFALPLMIGLMGKLVLKILGFLYKNKEIQKDTVQNKVKTQNCESLEQILRRSKQSILQNLLNRIIFEFAFYGLLITGYMAWISSFQGFMTGEFLNLIGGIAIVLVWTIYGVLLIKSETQKFQFEEKIDTTALDLTSQNRVLLSNFGEFKDIRQQTFKNHQVKFGEKDGKVVLIYITFMLQTILISALIVYLPKYTYLSSILTIIVYAVNFGALFFVRKIFQRGFDELQHISICSSTQRNYVLRQAFNFVTIILVQIILLSVKIEMENSSNSTNILLNQVAPMSVLCLLFMSLIVNIILWILEIKARQLLVKIKIMIRIMSRKQKNGQNNGKTETDTDRKLESDQADIKKEMDKMFESQKCSTPIKSPFIGIQQANYSKKKLIEVWESKESKRRRFEQQWKAYEEMLRNEKRESS